MNTQTRFSRRGILLAFAMMLLPAVADEGKLAFRGDVSGKRGEKFFRFELTAPADKAVYYIVDADTDIALHDAEEQKRGRWSKVDAPWCAKPKYLKLAAGGSREFRVSAPETKLPWRIGVRLYDAKPAANVKFTQVWSAAVKN